MGCTESEIMPIPHDIPVSTPIQSSSSLPAPQSDSSPQRNPVHQQASNPQAQPAQQQVTQAQAPPTQNQPVSRAPPPPAPQQQAQIKAQQPTQKIQSLPEPLKEQQVGQARPKSPHKPKGLPDREKLDPKVNYEDDFVAHHLRYELSLTQLVSQKRIQRRQIMEHLMLQNYWGNIGASDVNTQAYFESVQASWMQRTILQIWENAHHDFFEKGEEARKVRRKVAEQYMFELFELKEYTEAGLGNLSFHTDKTRVEMHEFMQVSDEALFNLFKDLKKQYPQTSETSQLDIPDIPTTKTRMNLLGNFKSKCFSDPDNINIQTIYEDVEFMLKEATRLQHDFKADMKAILGAETLACPKVSQKINSEGKPEFNACAVRRVFVKWAENMLEKTEELQDSQAFLKFIRAKAEIANNFFFKSRMTQTTHKAVIDIMGELLEVSKYDMRGQGIKNKEFIFNIYDLLRCKIKKPTANEVIELLRKMEATSKTPSGQRFEVIRVKNRLQTNNRDLLINFRYGDILVGEAQLGIDSTVSKLAKLNYQFCHYIYELERSLFGPSLELMMQYQDYTRPDVSMSFEAEGPVEVRADQTIGAAEPTKRLCMNGHEMVSLQGNVFKREPRQGEQQEPQPIASCSFCARITSFDDRYDYCFHCTNFLCRQCEDEYRYFNPNDHMLSVEKEELLPKINNINELKSACKTDKAHVTLFVLENSSPSQMFKDTLLYHLGKLRIQPRAFRPKASLVTFSPQTQKLCNQLGIKQFPTWILFDQNAKPFRTIIGFSWMEAHFIFETQRRIVKGEEPAIKLSCGLLNCSEEVTMMIKKDPEVEKKKKLQKAQRKKQKQLQKQKRQEERLKKKQIEQQLRKKQQEQKKKEKERRRKEQQKKTKQKQQQKKKKRRQDSDAQQEEEEEEEEEEEQQEEEQEQQEEEEQSEQQEQSEEQEEQQEENDEQNQQEQEQQDQQQRAEDDTKLCTNCFNECKPINMPPHLEQSAGYCGDGHYRCINCSYAALEVPATYKDLTGSHYLSVPVVKPNMLKCPKGHATKLVRENTLGTWEYTCFNCKKKHFFDDENGTGVCEQCKVGLCQPCMGFGFTSIDCILKDQENIATHYVESTAEQAHLCACGRYFKKVYSTRALSWDELFYQKHNGIKDKWKCTLCQQQFTEGQLHLACFSCPAMSAAVGKKFNFEICMKCAKQSELLMKTPDQKVQEQPSPFTCPKKHKMVRTSKRSRPQELTVQCIFCKVNYYAHTEHLHCKKCKTNCCVNCLKQLKNKNPPKCNQICREQCQLQLMYTSADLSFCEGCMKILKKDHYHCADHDYSLCLECADKPPGFVGTAFVACRKGLKREAGEEVSSDGDHKQQEEEESSEDEDRWQKSENYGEHEESEVAGQEQEGQETGGQYWWQW